MEPMNVEKYRNDTVFQILNKKFISLQEADVKKNNVHLMKAINMLLQKLTAKDAFFKKVFRRIMFGGSYYKGTKVGMPEEFDLNIIVKLPIDYDLIQVEHCQPGFIKIHSGLCPTYIHNIDKTDRIMCKLLDKNMYLYQHKFRHWMESILDKTIKELPHENDESLLMEDNTVYKIKVKKTGPAFTLIISTPEGKLITVDMVPVLEFTKKWPTQRQNFFKKRNWFVVPKPLNYMPVPTEANLCWRLCFPEQEKEILDNHGYIKPVIRQIKKLRDTQKWKNLASYYIETLFYHMLTEKNVDLSRTSSTSIFIYMLKEMYYAFQKHQISFYWDANLNLLNRIKAEEMKNMENRLMHIINEIDKFITTDQYIIAKYVLTFDEFALMPNGYSLSTSQEKDSKKLESSKDMLLDPAILKTDIPKKTNAEYTEESKNPIMLDDSIISTFSHVLSSLQESITNLDTSLKILTDRITTLEDTMRTFTINGKSKLYNK